MKSFSLFLSLALTTLSFNASAESLFKKKVNGVKLYDLILKQDVPEKALKRVFEFLDANGNKTVVVKEKGYARRRMILVDKQVTVQEDYTTIVDYSKPSSEPRLYLINLNNGSVGKYLVAHGRGSGVRLAAKFSNTNNSKMTSLGLYLGGTPYKGRHGTSLRMYGLEATNSNATLRDIVIHSAKYVSYDYVKAQGRLGRSWGCPAVSPGIISKIISTMRDGSVVYGYHPDIMDGKLKNPTLQQAPHAEDDEDIDLPDEEETERAKTKKSEKDMQEAPSVPPTMMVPAILPPPRPNFEELNKANEVVKPNIEVAPEVKTPAKEEKKEVLPSATKDEPKITAPEMPAQDAAKLEQLIKESIKEEKTAETTSKVEPKEEDSFITRWVKKLTTDDK